MKLLCVFFIKIKRSEIASSYSNVLCFFIYKGAISQYDLMGNLAHALLLVLGVFLSSGVQSSVLNSTNSIPAIQVGFERAPDGVSIEPCSFGFFNNDITREKCQSCGRGVSTARIASTDISDCSVCDVEYVDAMCLRCNEGFYNKAGDGVCVRLDGVVIILKVIIFVHGIYSNNLENQIIHAFAGVLNIALASFSNADTGPALTLPTALNGTSLPPRKMEFNITVLPQQHPNTLQRAFLSIDAVLLSTYPGLSGLNITVHTVSIAVDTKAVVQQNNVIFITIVVCVSLVSAGLLVWIMCCLFRRSMNAIPKLVPVKDKILSKLHLTSTNTQNSKSKFSAIPTGTSEHTEDHKSHRCSVM